MKKKPVRGKHHSTKNIPVGITEPLVPDVQKKKNKW